MLSHLKVENILFLDIETVPIVQGYSDLVDNFQRLRTTLMVVRFQGSIGKKKT